MSRQKKTTIQSTVAKKDVNEPRTIDDQIQDLKAEIAAINRQTKAIVSEKRLYSEGDAKYAELEEQYKELNENRNKLRNKLDYRKTRTRAARKDIRSHNISLSERRVLVKRLTTERDNMSEEIKRKREKLQDDLKSGLPNQDLAQEIAEMLITKKNIAGKMNYHQKKLKT